MKLTKRVLMRRAKPVDFTWPFQNYILAQKMTAFMQQHKGIGLAAPQIGERFRLFVMLIDGRQRWCFNPEIMESSTVLTEYNEGCLSFIGDQCTITRPDWVKVTYQNYQGEAEEHTLTGLEARCFQHELDHLEGITMWDRYKEQHAEQS